MTVQNPESDPGSSPAGTPVRVLVQVPDFMAPPEEIARKHRRCVDGFTYGALASTAQKSLEQTETEYVEHYLAEMAPRNPAERMLAVQMLWQHARLARHLRLAANTTNVGHLKALDLAIDAGLNVYRKQAETWAALKSPRPVQIIAGRQINMAGQQVVSNSGPGPKQARSCTESNEQGSTDVAPRPPALPAEPGWAGFAPDFRSGREALDPIHRPADSGGQGPVQP